MWKLKITERKTQKNCTKIAYVLFNGSNYVSEKEIQWTKENRMKNKNINNDGAA